LFQAVQAALLPRLAELIGKGALDEFRHGFRRLVLVVTGVAALGALGSAVLGPYLLQKVFQAHLSALTVTLLAVGSGVYMIALTFAQAVIALHGHALVAIGWLAGMITFALVTWLSSHDLFLRVELSAQLPVADRCSARRSVAAGGRRRHALRGVGHRSGSAVVPQ